VQLETQFRARRRVAGGAAFKGVATRSRRGVSVIHVEPAAGARARRT